MIIPKVCTIPSYDALKNKESTVAKYNMVLVRNAPTGLLTPGDGQRRGKKESVLAVLVVDLKN